MFSAIVFGVSWGGLNICSTVLRATLITRNIDRTGNRNEASYYGLMNFSLRLGGMLHSLSMLLMGVLFGYVSGENPGAQPGLAFRFLISAMPMAGLAIAALFAHGFFQRFPQLSPSKNHT